MKTLVFGAAVIDMIMVIPSIPESGGDVMASESSTQIGGCAYNVASTMRNMKADHDLCVPAGSGNYGDMIRKRLGECGYPVIIHDEKKDNGYCLCLVEDGGERTFITHQGVEGEFRKEWFDNISMDEYSSIYLSGYQALGENGRKMVEWLEILDDIEVFFAPGPVICQIDSEVMERITALHPVMHLNDKEVTEFTGISDVGDAAAKLHEATGSPVIVTAGPEGAYLMERGILKKIPAVHAEVKDTIGAGDSHIGAVLACLNAGDCLEDAVAKANRVASAVVEIKGAVMDEDEFRRRFEGEL